MKNKQRFLGLLCAVSVLILSAFQFQQQKISIEIFETSANGNQLEQIKNFPEEVSSPAITIFPDQKFQTVIGFGGAFTESSAHLLNQLSSKNRQEVLNAYFGEEGAGYSLTRTHINSCDFSLGNYSYAPVSGDTLLENFSIEEDRDDLIPMIKDAMEVSKDGFKIMASPWTAPPWMKDNNSWKGGKLQAEYYDTWALYFSRYLSEYEKEGIDIWAITIENEPLGNGENWESMHFTPHEMVAFANQHLGPKLEDDGHEVLIFGYDQNRGKELIEWAEIMYEDEASSKYIDGTAVHWYASTVDWMPKSLNIAHELAEDKHLIQSEGCIDAEKPHWKDDAWYWKKEATDWGWDWAPEEDKHYHPKYVPVYRYARDMIGCLNNWVEGWIDWNMVLDRQGGPNWAKNWCIAPVIVDVEKDEVYYTPLYHTMVHFSRYIRPGAVRVGIENPYPDHELMATAVENADGSIVIVLLNLTEETKSFPLKMENESQNIQISPQAIQTIILT